MMTALGDYFGRAEQEYVKCRDIFDEYQRNVDLAELQENGTMTNALYVSLLCSCYRGSGESRIIFLTHSGTLSHSSSKTSVRSAPHFWHFISTVMSWLLVT